MILVGVDGSVALPGVLECAIAEARPWGVRLRVVHAQVAWRRPPAEVLRQAAAGAGLLVVGSHGRGTFAGTVLGSVSHALLHHAPCPLAVTRRTR